MRQGDARDIEAFGTNESFGKIYECLVGIDMLNRLAALASRRVSSSRSDSVRNGIYQGRLVTQLD